MAKSPSSSIQDRFEILQDAAVELISTHELQKILQLILEKACHLMMCDAGSVYVKHNKDELVFEATINRSVKTDFQSRVISTQANRGLAVYAFNHKINLNVTDAYTIDAKSPYVFDRTFDTKNQYRTRSILVQPLVSRHGQVMGVLQMINRKNQYDEAWPSQDEKQIAAMPGFDAADEKMMRSFAALATAALENAMLYENIEKLFEGFVNAAIDAIESRDLTTSGHSVRVAELSVDFAEKLNRTDMPELRTLRFSPAQIRELRYAALLHDFGKISVNEYVLQKSKKLSDSQLAAIQGRLREWMQAFEIERLRELIVRAKAQQLNDIELARMDQNIRKFKIEIDQYGSLIDQLNEPAVLSQDLTDRLAKLKNIEFSGAGGEKRILLDQNEIATLGIMQGSLSEDERKQIESHVTHTYLFLKNIPWTWGLDSVPEIAYAHHEKLDGSGYPRQLKKAAIPVQSQMMTICDIYDALVAKDRPYKKAIAPERALDIIARDAARGKINGELFKLFVEAEVYKASADGTSRRRRAA